jgi:hypothetical protein
MLDRFSYGTFGILTLIIRRDAGEIMQIQEKRFEVVTR